MHLTFLVGNFAIKQLNEYSVDREKPNREALCTSILDKVNDFLDTTEDGQAFVKEFTNAKTALQIVWSNAYNRSASEHARQILGRRGRKIIAELGKAVGKPNSPERRRQLEDL